MSADPVNPFDPRKALVALPRALAIWPGQRAGAGAGAEGQNEAAPPREPEVSVPRIDRIEAFASLKTN